MPKVMNFEVLNHNRLNYHLSMFSTHTSQDLDSKTRVKLNMFFTIGLVLAE